MNIIKVYHDQAMDLAEQAVLARLRGDFDAESAFLEQSLEMEAKAAHDCAANLEPTRSVLFRSAASLALQCHKLDEAESLAFAGLAGTPPEEIANELRDVLEQIAISRQRRRIVQSDAFA